MILLKRSKTIRKIRQIAMHHGIYVTKTGWNNQREDAQYHHGWLPCICNIYNGIYHFKEKKGKPFDAP
jgi:hypothetical protein